MIDTLSALDSIQAPGTIRDLPYRWEETDQWKASVMRPDAAGEHSDSRTERDESPQYQAEADRAFVSDESQCPGCFFVEAT